MFTRKWSEVSRTWAQFEISALLQGSCGKCDEFRLANCLNQRTTMPLSLNWRVEQEITVIAKSLPLKNSFTREPREAKGECSAHTDAACTLSRAAPAHCFNFGRNTVLRLGFLVIIPSLTSFSCQKITKLLCPMQFAPLFHMLVQRIP